MSTIFNALLEILSNLVSSHLPSFDIADTYLNNIAEGMQAIEEFLEMVNFIIPLPDIAIILGLDLAIRALKLALFLGNWTIRRILDAIP